MKAILVIDIPDDMNVEETKALNVTMFNGLFVKELKIDCPLKPLPQKDKYNVKKYATVDYENEETLGHYLNIGWNDCIDTILGEEE